MEQKKNASDCLGAEKTHKMHQALHGAEENTLCMALFLVQKKYTTLYIKQMEEIPFPHKENKKSLFKKKIVNTDYYIARNANTDHDMVT